MAPPADVDEPTGDDHLADRLGYAFARPELLRQALAHRSWCAEHSGDESNERLEYLGDAVLGLIVADHTYRTYGELSDGVLSKVRASVVNARVLADVAHELGIPDHLRLGKGEDASGGRTKESILADTMEAVIGAVYLDGGMERARELVLAQLAGRIAAAVGEPGESDHKSRLQEVSVRLGRGVPRYDVEGSGPDHARRYLATVYVSGQRLGVGEGRSKKDAEQVAAQAACGYLEAERGGGHA
ncbi:MAG: ribonuclease III [Acidimicrobiales bacterium]|jgi:ribonuclease-3